MFHLYVFSKNMNFLQLDVLEIRGELTLDAYKKYADLKEKALFNSFPPLFIRK